jgi:hypothetical protein
MNETQTIRIPVYRNSFGLHCLYQEEIHFTENRKCKVVIFHLARGAMPLL